MKTAIYVRVWTNDQTTENSSPTSKPWRLAIDETIAATSLTIPVETDPPPGVLPLWIAVPSESSGTFVSLVSTLGSKKMVSVRRTPQLIDAPSYGRGPQLGGSSGVQRSGRRASSSASVVASRILGRTSVRYSVGSTPLAIAEPTSE